MKLNTSTYRSPLRRAQAEGTRTRIVEAMAGLLTDGDGPEAITYKSVAAAADVTEMTVYRYFPSREALLEGLWSWLNTRIAPGVGMPASEAALTEQLGPLFEGFDRVAPQIRASLFTPQGREMRASLDGERQRAFLAALDDAARGLDARTRRRAAAAIQLLHSAYAWLSMREQWGLDATEAADVSAWVIRLVLADLRKQPRARAPRKRTARAAPPTTGGSR